MELVDRFRGSILGLAIGDALGHPTEFISSVRGIQSRYGPNGVTEFFGSGGHPPGTFTDDTQMTISVARALIRAGHKDLDSLMTLLGDEFVAWANSDLNNRAPGGTCLSGCRNFARGASWRDAGIKSSKGCGAAMRAAPIGLYFATNDEALVRIAAAQSVLTHSHPTGIASSVAAAAPVAWVARGNGLEGMLAFTKQCVSALTNDILLDLGCDPSLVESIGTREMMRALERTEQALDKETDDVCQLLGGAWIGEEAVACALWYALKAEGDFERAVLRGANSSGDSDSIACIAGSIVGTLVGVQGLPERWVKGVEESKRLDELAQTLHSAMTSADVEVIPELDFFGAEEGITDEPGEEEPDEGPGGDEGPIQGELF